ncbi:Alpha/Beta hydrolase protein [Radiomyces spectabilis]|uniref:Alpha/Beta hydrolase protein n=1 Tax=Radiomyces spectabilis TaxID=64574 RepID=UPI00221FD71C|nr:Alpha/Beta hydrolase protein [Radiomyces spectabilis]KAI8384649.1 Alpha/Beta hydrolase protein [Radiomyces spectabilis]
MHTLHTLRKKGLVEVAAKRESKPVRLYYEVHGDGPETVLLVMGLSTPCSAWDNQVRYLGESKKYTVVIFDNRGMGLSDAPIGFYSTSQMALDALELLDYLGWEKRVHLVGISMGGMISLEMVDAAPDRFASLTLTSTAAKRNIPTWKAVSTLSKIAFMYRYPKDQLNAGIELIYPKEWLDQKPTTKTQYDTNREMAIDNFIKYIRQSRLQPLRGNVGQTVACLRHYFSDERLLAIKKSGLPVLIVTGTWDNLVRPEYSYHMKKVLDARLELFQGSGHGIPEEQPHRYNQLLDEHFTSSVSSSPPIAKL